MRRSEIKLVSAGPGQDQTCILALEWAIAEADPSAQFQGGWFPMLLFWVTGDPIQPTNRSPTSANPAAIEHRGTAICHTSFKQLSFIHRHPPTVHPKQTSAY